MREKSGIWEKKKTSSNQENIREYDCPRIELSAYYILHCVQPAGGFVYLEMGQINHPKIVNIHQEIVWEFWFYKLLVVAHLLCEQQLIWCTMPYVKLTCWMKLREYGTDYHKGKWWIDGVPDGDGMGEGATKKGGNLWAEETKPLISNLNFGCLVLAFY